MDDLKVNEIIDSNRHQFIYCKNNFDRKKLLDYLEDTYSFCIRLKDFSLPDIKRVNNSNSLMLLIVKEYLNLSIAHDILLNVLKHVKKVKNFDKNNPLLRYLNRLYNGKFSSLDDILHKIEKSKKMYMQFYDDCINNNYSDFIFGEIPIPFIMLNGFVRNLKIMIDNSFNFAFIIDNQEDISVISTRAINDYMFSNISNDLSFKIISEPNKWKSYSTLDRNYLDDSYYDVIKLGDLMDSTLKKVKSKHFINR